MNRSRRNLVVFFSTAACCLALGCAEELAPTATRSTGPDFSLRTTGPDAATLLPVLDAATRPDAANPPSDARRRDAGSITDTGTLTDMDATQSGCDRDLDCQEAERCLNGLCQPAEPDPCEGVNCPAGFGCENGDCVYQPCELDRDCPAGQNCVNQECIENDSPCGLCPEPRFCVGDRCAQCRVNDDCLDGFECVNLECRLPAGPDDECRNDDECAPDEICRRGQCVDDPEPSPCGVCPLPRFCVGAVCAECQDDADCPGDFQCEDLRCVFRPPEPDECEGDAECPGGRCVDGQCEGIPNPNNACLAPVEYQIGRVIQGNTGGASSNHTGTCSLNADAPEQVFTFIADQNEAICVTTHGSAFNTNLYVRARTCEEGLEPDGACNINNGTSSAEGRVALLNVENQTDSTLHFLATAGTRYFIFVDGWHRSSGRFILSTRSGWCDRNRPPPTP